MSPAAAVLWLLTGVVYWSALAVIVFAGRAHRRMLQQKIDRQAREIAILRAGVLVRPTDRQGDSQHGDPHHPDG